MRGYGAYGVLGLFCLVWWMTPLPVVAGTEPVGGLRPAAELGDAEAQFCLGECFLRGDGVERSYVEAAMWFREAARQGYAPAQRALSLCYERGLGVPQSPAEAAEWCRQAAEQGLAEAQNAMAYCYYEGRGVEKNDAEAVRLWRAAAAQRWPEAVYALALCYLSGTGVAPSAQEAGCLLVRAVRLGVGRCLEGAREASAGGRGCSGFPAVMDGQHHEAEDGQHR